MTAIKHLVTIKTNPEKVYQAVTTQKGISAWWCKNTTAKPEIGFVNVFIFGSFRNEMKVSNLTPNKKAEWQCVNSIDEWIGTTISFDLEEKNGNSILRFTQDGWRAETDTFAGCNFDWGRFMSSLKAYCETGIGSPS